MAGFPYRGALCRVLIYAGVTGANASILILLLEAATQNAGGVSLTLVALEALSALGILAAAVVALRRLNAARAT